MAETNHCPACGATLRGDLPAGLCSACLLAQALSAEPNVSSPPEAHPIIRRDLPPLAEQPGDVIGRYKLLEQIGEGGCGVVYMAAQAEPIKRRVALKVIKPGMDTKQVLGRFEAERQVLALMDHPNIAKVLDAGATTSSRPYFVMELVHGIPATRYCDENKLTTRQRLELFLKICQAIQHAHQKGIIHRDIKPSNILVADHDGAPVPKVIDFGIAKATSGQELTTKTVFTAFEQFMGTPAYMSPEQAKMSGLDIDTRSDIYSLGVLLYELMTGKTPFDAKELYASGLDEIRRIIREVEPPRPSTRLSTLTAAERTRVAGQRQSEPPKLQGLIRGDLDWIVMKCLEKDRTRRYETANGLAADLKRHLENEPVSARPPSQMYRLQKMVRRNTLAVAAGTAVAVALIIGMVVSTVLFIQERKADTLANQRLADSEAIAKFMTEVFQSPDPARNGRTITVAEALGAATQKLETELVSQPLRRAKLQGTLGATYESLGLDREAIPLLEASRDYFVATAGPENPDTLSAMDFLAIAYDTTARRDEARQLRETILAVRRRELGRENPDTLTALNNLATSYDETGRQAEALKMREEVLALRRKVLGPEHPDTLEGMSNLAISYETAGRLEEALKLKEEVLTLARKIHGPKHPLTLIAINNLGIAYQRTGRRDAALKLAEQALPLEREVLGPEHPLTLLAMEILADSYSAAGRQDESLKLWEAVLPLRRKVLGAEHPETLKAMNNLANAYDEAGRRAEALKLREELLPLRRQLFGQENLATINAMGNLAISYDEAGRRDEALKLQEEVLKLARKVGGPKHPDTLDAMDNLADLYNEAGRREEALKLSEQELTLRREVNGQENPDTLEVMNKLAWEQATSAATELRNGTNAVRLAEEAVAATRRANPAFLNTLAAAYAETHHFDRAVSTQKEAIALLTTEADKQEYQSRLELYEAGTPCHQPARTPMP